jgi:hypothetical protein
MTMPNPKTLLVALLVGYVLLMLLGKAPRPF